MKYWCNLILFLIAFTSLAQTKDNGFYETIRRAAIPRIAPINAGEIENFKSITPPKDTWRYEDLEAFKKDLQAEDNGIYFGYFIEPSTQEDGVYAFNAFAFRQVGENYDYYFAAVIPIDTKNGFKPKTSYLFTVDVSLKSWWMHAYGIYDSGLMKDIPTNFPTGLSALRPTKRINNKILTTGDSTNSFLVNLFAKNQ